MKNLLLFFLFFIQFSNAFSQNFEQELKDIVSEEPKFDIRFDTRHSFINQTGVRVFGFKMGVQYADKLSFGIGYNQLFSPITYTKFVDSIFTNVELAFYNFSPYVEYVFYRDSQWELSIPIQIGFGSSYYNAETSEGKKK